MRVYFFLVLNVIIALGLCAPARARQPMPNTGNLIGVTGQWLDLEKELQQQREEWTVQQSFLRQELELLDKEKAALTEQIAEAQERRSEFQRQTAELRLQERTLIEHQSRMNPLLRRAEEHVRQWVNRIPAALGRQDPVFALSGKKDEELASRLSGVLAALAALEKLHFEIHAVQEILSREDGTDQLFDVLYLGLAQAFAVSVDGRFAGRGVPGEDQWIWEWDASLVKPVREAMAVHQKTVEPRMISLPLRLERGDQP